MTHELKKIVQAYQHARDLNDKTVLATVVALEGSSYRRPGVCMLLMENGQMMGAVSGGCVEKEIMRQAQSVFKTGVSKVMTYDGRYRLGCEGILYILLELFEPNTAFIEHFQATLRDRNPFKMISYYEKGVVEGNGIGSIFQFGSERYRVNEDACPDPTKEVFEQQLEPSLQLYILGAEHDAVQLCSFAALAGWEVTVVSGPSEEKQQSDFPGSIELLAVLPEELPTTKIDHQTAIVLMNHSYVKDLQHLITLQNSKPFYIGVLGPYKRREELLNEFLERCPDVSEAFIDRIHGPSGLDIGAETPQEIAIAIIAEILMVNRERTPVQLKDKKGAIHMTSK